MQIRDLGSGDGCENKIGLHRAKQLYTNLSFNKYLGWDRTHHDSESVESSVKSQESTVSLSIHARHNASSFSRTDIYLEIFRPRDPVEYHHWPV